MERFFIFITAVNEVTFVEVTWVGVQYLKKVLCYLMCVVLFYIISIEEYARYEIIETQNIPRNIYTQRPSGSTVNKMQGLLLFIFLSCLLILLALSYLGSWCCLSIIYAYAIFVCLNFRDIPQQHCTSRQALFPLAL